MNNRLKRAIGLYPYLTFFINGIIIDDQIEMIDGDYIWVCNKKSWKGKSYEVLNNKLKFVASEDLTWIPTMATCVARKAVSDVSND